MTQNYEVSKNLQNLFKFLSCSLALSDSYYKYYGVILLQSTESMSDWDSLKSSFELYFLFQAFAYPAYYLKTLIWRLFTLFIELIFEQSTPRGDTPIYGMCRCSGYSFQTIQFRTGCINHGNVCLEQSIKFTNFLIQGATIFPERELILMYMHFFVIHRTNLCLELICKSVLFLYLFPGTCRQQDYPLSHLVVFFNVNWLERITIC